MSTRNAPAHAGTTSSNRRRVTKAVLLAFALAIPGALVGLIVGAIIGGNWFTSFSLGAAHGYEATANIGTVVGGVSFGAIGVWLGLRRPLRQR
jgi:hypothetical protein